MLFSLSIPTSISFSILRRHPLCLSHVFPFAFFTSYCQFFFSPFCFRSTSVMQLTNIRSPGFLVIRLGKCWLYLAFICLWQTSTYEPMLGDCLRACLCEKLSETDLQETARNLISGLHLWLRSIQPGWGLNTHTHAPIHVHTHTHTKKKHMQCY